MAASTKRAFLLEEFAIMLRAGCPVLEGRVGGVSMFNNVTTPNLNLPTPYCIIQRVSGYGEPYDKSKGLQVRHAVMSCIICGENQDQKGSGAGHKAVRAQDAIDTAVGQIEQAILEWKPVSINLFDTPLYMDEGFVGMNNTKLWHEVTWDIAYEVYNPAFLGIGIPIEEEEDEEPWTWETLNIHYGTVPHPLFLDAYIYGPQTVPPPSTQEVLEERLAEASQYDVEPEQVVVRAKQPHYHSQALNDDHP